MAVEFLSAPAVKRFAFTQYPAAARSVTDGVTNSTTTVTSATAAFSSLDVGATIVGTGVPALATIVSVTNGTTVVISASATATASGVTLTITRTNALALSAFQTAYQTDISALAAVQALAYTATPTVATIVTPNAGPVLSVNPTDYLGLNYGTYQVVPKANMGRQVTDAVTTASSTTVTSATAAFTSGDVGANIATANLPVGTTIVSVTNGTTVVVSANATASGSAQSATITPTAALFVPANV